MKKVLILFVVCCCTVSVIANSSNEINEKVKKSFKETFPDAKQVIWSENDFTYQVRFVRNAVDNRVSYDKEGTIISTIRYYNESHLPAFLLAKLKKKFNDKEIHLVTELNGRNGLEYHISLQDAEKWYVVKAYANGSMSVYDKYNKQLN